MDQAITHNPALILPTDSVSARGRRIILQLLVTALAGDSIIVFSALLASSWLRFESAMSTVGVAAHRVQWTDYLGHIALGTLLFIFVCAHLQLYSLNQMLRFRRTSLTLLKAACVWLVVYIAATFVLRFEQPVSRIFILMAFGITTTALMSWRYLFHKHATKVAVQGKLRQRILFVDWSPNTSAFIEAVTSDRMHLYEIAGCVSAPQNRYWHLPPNRVRKLGGYDDLPAVLQKHSIDMVILADLNLPDGEMVRLANLCEKEMVEFKVIPSCFQILVSGLHLETVRGVPVLGLSKLPLDNPFNIAIKQVMDFVGGIVGLILSAPLIALFGLLVYLESPGPIFYRQRRLGRDGQPFWIHKIRSMRLDAEKDGKVGWSTKHDDRRLRIGSIIRKWNIDETPQFWNVIKGEMSLVGPRPERPELIVNFKEEIPHYNARHNIKPGITGWAQINGFRGDTDLTERVRCDLYYIENWSPLLDVQIMFMTLFKRKNAC